MLRLGSFDGSLLPRMYRISDTPRDYMFDSLYLSYVPLAGFLACRCGPADPLTRPRSNHTDAALTRR